MDLCGDRQTPRFEGLSGSTQSGHVIRMIRVKNPVAFTGTTAFKRDRRARTRSI